MAQKDLWISILKRLKPTIRKAHFLTWFQNTTVMEAKDGVLIIGVPNAFSKGWLSSKYDLKILQASKEVAEEINSIEYEINGKLTDPDNNEGVDVKALFAEEDSKKVRKVRNLNEVKVVKGFGATPVSSQSLNSRYNLNNFVVGKDNRLPHAACTAVGNMPGGIYNPLYMYSGVGLGKTHLLQAVGNEILRNFPDYVVKYVTAERFVSEVVDAIGKRNMGKFKDQYRKVDCFLLDDVQFFARKDSSQQEFFHTFNELYDANKQIIITSDRPPSELDGLDERLKSRFGMGMLVELLFPDYETRVAILNQKCQEFNVLVDPEVLNFIASNVQHSVRELEGVLRQIVAEMQLFDRVATIHSVAKIMKKMNKANKIIGYDLEEKNERKAVMNSEEVIDIVADYFKISTTELVGSDRHKEIMIPRQVCMYLIRHELGESYEKIGLGFGGRNHTTVIHACNKTANNLKKDVKLVRDINSIKREMGM